jgi:hypothetical protein
VTAIVEFIFFVVLRIYTIWPAGLLAASLVIQLALAGLRHFRRGERFLAGVLWELACFALFGAVYCFV